MNHGVVSNLSGPDPTKGSVRLPNREYYENSKNKLPEALFPALTTLNTKKDKKRKLKKKTALVICRDRKEFWTTETQFWQGVREGIVVNTDDQPLTGMFQREHEELSVMPSNKVLNLAHPNHMREALLSRRFGLGGR